MSVSPRGRRPLPSYSRLKYNQDLGDAMRHHRPLEDGDTSDLKVTPLQRLRRFLGLKQRSR